MTAGPRLTGPGLAKALAWMAVLLGGCMLLALGVGSVELEFFDGGLSEAERLIFSQVRLPRVVLAALVGGALAMAGAALQPALRNPLASPDIIGVSGGAALAAVATLALVPWAAASPALVPAVAFAGAGFSSALVYRLALVRGRLDPYTQILVGVIFNTFAAALILLINATVDASRSQSIVFWLMGGIAIHSWAVIMLVGLLAAIGAVVLVAESRALNLMVLGEDAAEHLGVDLGKTRRRVFVASSLLVGAVVSLSGVITFVGLIVPHLLRRLLGSDNRLLVPASLLGGAAFLVLCDAFARRALAPSELPVGAITALVGGPFFIYLLRRVPRSKGL